MPRSSKLNGVFNLFFYYRSISSEIKIDSKLFYNGKIYFKYRIVFLIIEYLL